MVIMESILPSIHVRDNGVWGRIVRSINSLHDKEFIPLSFLQKRVRNGTSTKFGHDVWMGATSLKTQFPRIYRLAMDKDCMVRDYWNNGWFLNWSRPITSGTNFQQLRTLSSMLDTYSLSEKEDTWTWSLGSPSFSVKCTREHIDKYYLSDGGSKTRWNRFLPKKINIFIWRVLRDRLPTRWNLSRRGIDMDTLSCPVCGSSIETMNHTLWFCSLATSVWHRISNWLDIDLPSPSNIHDLFYWIGNLRIISSKKDILEVICDVVLWSLRNFINDLIFGSSLPNRSLLFDSIVDSSFRWFSSRNKLSSISWNN
uniref:RNA-directed DNA polymerase, eukaryota n=1 Tax=Tanacetum cinerariifolium TaxID=118510 RepID=A0A6L2PCD6_TANCI|nr:RNA-directed DNA polymerase, eukaryota [Tanacetum cinerariifolium]